MHILAGGVSPPADLRLAYMNLYCLPGWNAKAFFLGNRVIFFCVDLRHVCSVFLFLSHFSTEMA